MIAKLEASIAALAEKAGNAPAPTEAMQYAQAACNLANALATVKNSQKAG